MNRVVKIAVILAGVVFLFLANGFAQIRYQLYLDHDIAYYVAHCPGVGTAHELRQNLMQSSLLFGGGDYLHDQLGWIGSRDAIMALSCVPLAGCLISPTVRLNRVDGCATE